MLKYIAAVVLVAATSIYVSIQYKRHAQPADCHAQQTGNGIFPAPDYKEPKGNKCNPEWNPPRWYRLFGWESLQTWGLFLTLIVIADQTKQTARAAAATEGSLTLIQRQVDVMKAQLKDSRSNSAEAAKTTQATLEAIQRQASLMERQINISINKQRAKIFVDLVPKSWAFLKEGYERKMEKIGDWDYADELDAFHIVLRNEGESESYNTVAQGEVTVTLKKDQTVLVSKGFESVLGIMRPGKSQDELGVDFFPPLEVGILEFICNGLATLRFSGRITYEDALEPERTHLTLFCFEWHPDQELIDYGDGGRGWADQSGWETRPPELNRFT